MIGKDRDMKLRIIALLRRQGAPRPDSLVRVGEEDEDIPTPEEEIEEEGPAELSPEERRKRKREERLGRV